MRQLHFNFTFIRFLLAFLCIGDAKAVLISLRDAETERNNFSVGSGKEFSLQVYIDPQGSRVTGFQIYLSFDDQYLKLLDATDKLTGLQPVKNGPGYPTGWQPLDNDTHGDPGNILRNFQIDYAAALMAIGDDVSVLREPSVVGLIKFKTLQPVKDTAIRFDFIERVSRITGVIVDQLPRRNFSDLETATITVRGTVDFKDSFPKNIKFPMNTEYTDLILDNYLIFNNPKLTPKEMKRSIKWTASNYQNINVKIDPNFRRVSFRPNKDWFGQEKVRFTVIDPEGNPAFNDIDVQVTTPPRLLFSEKIPNKGERIRVNSGKNFNLNGLVEDLDNPGLADLNWNVGANPDPDNLFVNLIGSYLKVESTRLGTFDIPITVSDADDNIDQQTLKVLFIPEFDGPVIDPLFPQEAVSTNDGSRMDPSRFNLNELVGDFDFGNLELKWEISGNENITVNIDPETRDVSFENLRNWIGRETITFKVINPNGISDQRETQVQLIEKSAPPSIITIPPIELDFGKEKILDLKKHIFDLDSDPEQIDWVVEGQQFITIEINEERFASLQSESVVTETVRFFAVDPNGLQDTQDVIITVKSPEKPLLDGFPSKLRIKSNETTASILQLDDLVTDPTTPDELIVWQVTSYDKSKLAIQIEADRSVTLIALPNWKSGSETIIFSATNKAQLISTTEVDVQPMFPPKVSLEEFPTFAIYQGQKKIVDNLDLDNYVIDADTESEDIEWSSQVRQNNPKVQLVANINPNTHTVELSSGNTPVGDYQLDFKAIDPEGNVGSGSINVLVLKTQKPPVLNIPPISLIDGQIQTIDLIEYVTDDEPVDQIIWSFDNNENIIVELDNSMVDLINKATWNNGETFLIFKATDLDGKTSQQKVTVTVNQPIPPLKIEDLTAIEFEQESASSSYDLNQFVIGPNYPKSDIEWDIVPHKEIQVNFPEIGEAIFSAKNADFVGTVNLVVIAQIGDTAPVEKKLTVTVKEKVEKPPKPRIKNTFEVIELTEGETSQPIVLEIDPPDAQVEFTYDEGNQLVTPIFDKGQFTLTGNQVGSGIFSFRLVDNFQQSSQKAEIQVNVKEKIIPLALNLPKTITLSIDQPEETVNLNSFVTSRFDQTQLVWSISQMPTTIGTRLADDPPELTVELGDYDPVNGAINDEITLQVTETDPSGQSLTGKIEIQVLANIPTPKPPRFISPFPTVVLQSDVKPKHTVNELKSYVDDTDTADHNLNWIAIPEQNILAEIKNNSLILSLPKTTKSSALPTKSTVLVIVSDPEGNKAFRTLAVEILPAPKKKVKCDIYVLPNPLQSQFYTITIAITEGVLEFDPTIVVNEEPQVISAVDSERNQIWTLAYSINQGNNVEPISRLQVDVFEGDSDSGTKIDSRSVAITLPTAPNFSQYSYNGKISVYPNPIQQSTLHLVCPTVNPPKVHIYTIDGRFVTMINEFRRSKNGWEYSWDLQTHLGEIVSNGIYFAHFIIEDQFLIRSESIKLWIQK